MLRAGTLIFILFALGHANSFTIFPLPAVVTQFQPVIVSWARDNDDPPQWHLKKQNMNLVTDPDHDFTKDASEALPVSDPDALRGEVTITFTVSPGSFRLLAFDDGPTGTATTPFFISEPTITAVAPGDPSSQNGGSHDGVGPEPGSDNHFTPPFLPPSHTASSDTSISSPASSTESPVSPPGESSNSQTNDSHSSKVPIIVGGVLGGIVFFLLLFILAWVVRNRRRRERAARSVIFYQDKMVRQRDLENWEAPEFDHEGTLEDSKVFRFDHDDRKGVSTGVGNSNSVAHRVSPISVGDSLNISPLKSPSAHSF